MGARGPAKEPVALTLLKGERRPSRVNYDAPQPRARLPRMPVDMSAPAKTIWRRVMRDYAETGILTAVDTEVLRAYCEAADRYQKAATMLERSGLLVRGAHRGELVKNPLHQVVRDNAVLVKTLARELGFTPAARAGLRTGAGPEETDELERWIRGATG